MNNLITLADFPDFVPFSANIAPELVNPHIREAQTFDVWPLLPFSLRVDLATPANTWTPAVVALFAEFIKPLLVVESARRMLLWHGAHVTPAGVQTVSDPSTGAQPISGQQRTELRADMASKCSHYAAKLAAALRLAYPSAYATTCAAGRRRPVGGGATISAV